MIDIIKREYNHIQIFYGKMKYKNEILFLYRLKKVELKKKEKGKWKM